MRFALYGHPENSSLHDIYYGSINLATGAVASPGKTLTANIGDGTGLPLTPQDFAVVNSQATGHVTRLFAVCGTGNPAVALADWDGAANPATALYKHRELYTDPNRASPSRRAATPTRLTRPA